MLAGCTFSVGRDTAPTVAPQTIEDRAAGALENETGIRPDLDCGESDIPVEEGRSITCLLVDPVAGLEFDVVLTFVDVDFPEVTCDGDHVEIVVGNTVGCSYPSPDGVVDAVTITAFDSSAGTYSIRVD